MVWHKLEALCKGCFCSLLPKGARILAACSGGADSMALLDILWRLAPRFQWQVAVAHYEHGIRGEASLADARFVADFCQKRRIPCFVEHGDVPGAAAENSHTLEQAARDLRYAFLQRICREKGFGYIATAHHADDQAETVLMRILRGTGVKGLGAMRPYSGDEILLVRPLLGASKAEIMAYCEQAGLAFREDATNSVADCTRNRLRLELLPQLQRDYNPEIRRSLCQLAEVAAETSDFLQSEVNRYWQDAAYVRQGDWALSQKTVAGLHPALQRGLIRRLWAEVTGSALDLSYVQTERLRSLLLTGQTSSQQELSHHYVARLAYGYLQIDKSKPDRQADQSKSDQSEVAVPGMTSWGEWILQGEWRKPDGHKTLPHELYLDPANFSEPLVLRTRRPGDFMQLPGGRKKLKKLLIDDKIPQEERDRLLLLAAGSEIIWMIGRRRSARCLQGVADYHKILYLRIEKRGN
ncbi:putative tRNA(Ile)-lysidine synthase [Selenomonas ruminantium subsp. lactilytica TAM6421]|uniref:tRNA(Ile)-lysidine synthase n=1 Tax=Selenomonas ruminantium subsp. lactilytica (strain NBRC 103574 / TAM6421) TaxID=927704 RepID=I0GSZ5_SELRL|nr:tRNA lysidine(34) synthetase TilS [Selenomonas ruminantium]BAL83882.1 putative tRNA(Ile)-lysidine synthase [Selenomonas ruminantium subsp. lactilytica TAM6421]